MKVIRFIQALFKVVGVIAITLAQLLFSKATAQETKERELANPFSVDWNFLTTVDSAFEIYEKSDEPGHLGIPPVYQISWHKDKVLDREYPFTIERLGNRKLRLVMELVPAGDAVLGKVAASLQETTLPGGRRLDQEGAFSLTWLPIADITVTPSGKNLLNFTPAFPEYSAGMPRLPVDVTLFAEVDEGALKNLGDAQLEFKVECSLPVKVTLGKTSGKAIVLNEHNSTAIKKLLGSASMVRVGSSLTDAEGNLVVTPQFLTREQAAQFEAEVKSDLEIMFEKEGSVSREDDEELVNRLMAMVRQTILHEDVVAFDNLVSRVYEFLSYGVGAQDCEPDRINDLLNHFATEFADESSDAVDVSGKASGELNLLKILGIKGGAAGSYKKREVAESMRKAGWEVNLTGNLLVAKDLDLFRVDVVKLRQAREIALGAITRRSVLRKTDLAVNSKADRWLPNPRVEFAEFELLQESDSIPIIHRPLNGGRIFGIGGVNGYHFHHSRVEISIDGKLFFEKDPYIVGRWLVLGQLRADASDFRFKGGSNDYSHAVSDSPGVELFVLDGVADIKEKELPLIALRQDVDGHPEVFENQNTGHIAKRVEFAYRTQGSSALGVKVYPRRTIIQLQQIPYRNVVLTKLRQGRK